MVVLALFFILLFLGMPIGFTLGLAGLAGIIDAGGTSFLSMAPKRFFAGLNLFPFLAMPFFILAGEIMNHTGITHRLVQFAETLVGYLRGGLAHTNMVASVFFAGISGSAVADAAALSNTLVPAMRERGYTEVYAGAVTAASSIIGPIVPPSIILIFYGALMGTSVTALFLAGILPGLLLAAALFVVNAFYAWKDDHPRLARGETPPLVSTFLRSAPALVLPLVIVGGIVLGWMTPTEAAAVAVFAALAAGSFYEGLTVEGVLASLKRTATLSGSIFMIIAAIAALGHLGALERLPEAISAIVVYLGLGPIEFMILLNIILIVAGMVLDVPVALALLVPLLAPVALAQGADPVHLGIVVCFNLCIGLVSPPLGGCLLVVSAVTGTNYWRLARAVIPFVAVEIIVLGILVSVPEISLFIPRAFGLGGG